jgi:hypothetical protein
MYTKELSDVTDNMTRRNGNPKKTKNSLVQSSQSLNQGSWNLALRLKEILSGGSRESNLEKTFPSSSRQSLNWGIYSLCTGLSVRRFFQEAAENAMQIASKHHNKPKSSYNGLVLV